MWDADSQHKALVEVNHVTSQSEEADLDIMATEY